MHFNAYGYTLPEAYHKAIAILGDCLEDGIINKNNGFVDCSMTMFVAKPMYEPRISRLFPGGPYDLERYRQEILDGIFDFEVEAGKWDYTYHQRLDRWVDDFILPELKRDLGSRRAVISIRDNEADSATENPACLQSIQFLARDDKYLDMCVLFRSNDAVRATFMNAFALTELQNRVAKELGLSCGSYVHHANSFHCYPESMTTLVGYLGRIASGKDLTYRYEGEWDALMKAERPAIRELVDSLRRQEGLNGLQLL